MVRKEKQIQLKIEGGKKGLFLFFSDGDRRIGGPTHEPQPVYGLLTERASRCPCRWWAAAAADRGGWVLVSWTLGYSSVLGWLHGRSRPAALGPGCGGRRRGRRGTGQVPFRCDVNGGDAPSELPRE